MKQNNLKKSTGDFVSSIITTQNVFKSQRQGVSTEVESTSEASQNSSVWTALLHKGYTSTHLIGQDNHWRVNGKQRCLIAMSRSSTTSTTSTVARSEKPGLRTPMTGYMGHVPGMVALNLHGGVWRDLILQDPLLNKPGTRKTLLYSMTVLVNVKNSDVFTLCWLWRKQCHVGLRPMSARSGSQTARASAPQRPMSAQSPKSLASESRRLSAEVAGLQVSCMCHVLSA